MLIQLHSPRRKLLFAVLCLGLLAGYVYRTARSYQVARSADSTDPDVLQRAVRLESQNAAAWYRLGRVRSILVQDVPGAIPALQRAVELDPRHARYWLDLGFAYQYTGDRQAQRKAIETAAQLDAHDPDIAWEAGNYYLLAGDTEKTLQMFRASLEGDVMQKHFSRAALLALRATNNDFMRVLNEVVPRSPKMYLAYTEFLLFLRQDAEADQVWSRTLELDKSIVPVQTTNYLASLEKRNESAKARAAWSGLVKLDPELQPYAYTSDNLVINGGFENNILNFGYDWQYTRRNDVALEIDNELFHSGNHALLMTFNGQPVEDIGLRQAVPLDGGQCYALSGFMRSSELEGVSGPRLAVRDLKTARMLAQSDEMSGTHGWMETRQNFRTDPGTRFVELTIVRDQPRTAIRGRAWVDDLQLAPMATESCR